MKHQPNAKDSGTEFRGYDRDLRGVKSDKYLRSDVTPVTSTRPDRTTEDVARATSLHPSQMPPEQSSEATTAPCAE